MAPITSVLPSRSSQKLAVPIASRVVREGVLAASVAVGFDKPPSGNSPMSRGAERVTQMPMGKRVAKIMAPIASKALRQPKVSISQ